MLRVKNTTKFDKNLSAGVTIPAGQEANIQADAMWITKRPLYKSYIEDGSLKVVTPAKQALTTQAKAPAKKGITQTPKKAQTAPAKDAVANEDKKDGDT